MSELATLQSAAYIAQIVGVVGTLTAAFIGVRSYISSNKRAEEARARELETRQAQVFLQFYSRTGNEKFVRAIQKLMSWNLSDYDKVIETYHPDNNPDF